jgi:TPR repeat protein
MKIIFILSILLLIGLHAENHRQFQRDNVVHQYNFGLHNKNPKDKINRDTFRRIHKFALKGYPLAQYDFALMFHYGIGVRQNFELARLWFRRASKNGEYRAKTILYRFYSGKKIDHRDMKYPPYYTQNFRTIRQ